MLRATLYMCLFLSEDDIVDSNQPVVETMSIDLSRRIIYTVSKRLASLT